MLVLNRRAGQAIRIGDDVHVHVLRVEGDRVVLGIDAPSDITIVREELLAAVSDEVRSAADARGLVRELLGPRT